MMTTLSHQILTQVKKKTNENPKQAKGKKKKKQTMQISILKSTQTVQIVN